jgi:hypothetical protein
MLLSVDLVALNLGQPASLSGVPVHWWTLIPIAAAVLLSLYGLFRWASADAGIDDERAKERFRAEQDWRGLRRSGSDVTPPTGEGRLHNVP